MQIFYILGAPLGYVMEWIYRLIPNYGWDIILFTLLVRLVSLPLTIKQQKTTARMSAFQPMILDLQKKYKNDPEKQQAEMTKLQQDFGYSPTAGCLPMFLNLFVTFGVIEVVYRPLQRMLHIGEGALNAAGEVLTGLGETISTVTRDSTILRYVVDGVESVTACFTGDELAKIQEFSTHMDFFGINLTAMPRLEFSAEALPLLIFPVLSIVTMFASQAILMKSTGQDKQMNGSMKIMMYAMPLMYVWFGFTVPVGFSLYYTVSNIVMTVQSLVLRKIYDPEKLKEQVLAEIAAKKKQQASGVKNTTIKVTDEKTGRTVEKKVSAAEMNKMRLEYARMLDEEKYRNERTEPLNGSAAEREEE